MEHFLKVLETEIHEKTLVHALEMLSKWGAKFTEVPKKLIDWFAKGMSKCSYKIKTDFVLFLCFINVQSNL